MGSGVADKRFMDSSKGAELNLDAIRGSLLGGAVGDALGYPVEFDGYNDIVHEYGEGGITEYKLSKSGKALISDDTQMTLFTANGILFGDTRRRYRGRGARPSSYVKMSYNDWLETQQVRERGVKSHGISWLLNVPELYSRRAPGNTCLSALMSGEDGTIENPINDSKGCGGVMRVAPLGLRYKNVGSDTIVKEGAAIAAITHGHSLGYIPAGMLALIVNLATYCRDEYATLKEVILKAKEITNECFKDDENIKSFDVMIDKAIDCAENDKSDIENITELGEGWVAEETLAVTVYCSLKYENDFSKGIIAAVNHDGDSDSTGALTGNILGAWLGFGAIEDKWKKNLELYDVIIEMADDLCQGRRMSEYGCYDNQVWIDKYVGDKLPREYTLGRCI